MVNGVEYHAGGSGNPGDRRPRKITALPDAPNRAQGPATAEVLTRALDAAALELD